MDIKEIQAFLGEDWTKTADLFRSSLHSDVKLLNDTNEYLLQHEGKQIRPVLGLLMARACGALSDESIHIAVASELLHNATLLHDDVVDSGSQRHGAQSVASMMGGKSSVLIGDFWLVKTMLEIAECGNHYEPVARAFSKTVLNLAEGEMLQLEKAELGDTTEDDYNKIIFSKTASLFEAVCYSAAVSTDAPSDIMQAAKEFGTSLGMAFQIKDDIMDYEGQELGKPTGVDLKERKITLPLLGVLQKMSAEQASAVRKMICEIPEKPGNSDIITDLVKKMGGIEYAKAKLDEYVCKAKTALEILPESKEREYLFELADYCAYRTI